MSIYPARYRLRAVSEVSLIQEKWGVPPCILDPGEILVRVISGGVPGMQHKVGKWKKAAVMNSLRVELDPLFWDHYYNHCLPPLNPRRIFSAQIIEDDPYRPKIPKPLSKLPDWSILKSVRENMKFWLRTLFWLKGLLALMDESIGKSYVDLFVLDSGPETVGEGENQRPYWRIREIIPTDEAMDLFMCNLDRRFYGPGYVPVVAGLPSNEDIATIRAFKSSHHREKLKFMQHLFFLYEIIDEELIPQVDSKLEDLVNRELEWLQKNDRQPATPYYIDYEDLEYVDSGISVQSSCTAGFN
ncbi:uncharacterized protein LOC119349181 [Triticum dicoccoides]|uniref:uncharacterized protein LOC119349181 n=1 Tax=Triticum dicoccoides TaxID=85692 RepID=UPI00188F5016|nr:uncharacterized protein LOC119349181 [Triticum dicoccoides]